MARRRRLPARVWSALGPVPVRRQSLRRRGLWGEFDRSTRTILVATEIEDATAVQTLWHEIVHLALTDGQAGLPEDVEERVCDAVAHYLAGMQAAGHLSIRSPPK